MNKKTILKMILLIITIALITCISTSVLAADDDDALDLSGSITDKEDKTDEDTTTENENTTTDKETSTENKDTTTNKETTTENKDTTTNKETTVDKNIPQTGLEDTMPIAILFVVCGARGVYTFIKLSQYSNI